MNDLRKAAERALEAFEKIHEGCGCVKEDNLSKESNDLATLVRKDCIPQIKSLRQALTPEVTPEVTPDVDNAKLDTSDRVLHKEWVGLTHDEVMCIWYENGFECMIYAKAIEAKLKEKNVPQP